MTPVPCLVLGQETSIITRGLQYSTLMLGSLEEGGPLLCSSSGSRPPTSVCTRGDAVEVVRGHRTSVAGVVEEGFLAVVVLDVVLVEVVIRGVELVIMVVVSM